MMKIQTQDSGDVTTFRVEGRLAGAWVPELEACWHDAAREHPERQISVDLAGVTCVDLAGRYLLEWMHRSGVAIVGQGLIFSRL
jgi:hypothetical protein